MRHRVLAKVTKVVVLGSYLRADVDRLSDLDIAVELQPKEANWDRLRELTLKRVEQLQMAGRGFRNWLEMEPHRAGAAERTLSALGHRDCAERPARGRMCSACRRLQSLLQMLELRGHFGRNAGLVGRGLRSRRKHGLETLR